MNPDNDKSARVLMYGLDDGMANELRTALGDLSMNVRAQPCNDLDQCLTHLDGVGTQAIFCSFDNGLYSLLTALKGHDVPVIAVSRSPEVHQWLDAMEAGASDFCATPFETLHLKWILQSNIHSPFKAA